MLSVWNHHPSVCSIDMVFNTLGLLKARLPCGWRMLSILLTPFIMGNCWVSHLWPQEPQSPREFCAGPSLRLCRLPHSAVSQLEQGWQRHLWETRCPHPRRQISGPPTVSGGQVSFANLAELSSVASCFLRPHQQQSLQWLPSLLLPPPLPDSKILSP